MNHEAQLQEAMDILRDHERYCEGRLDALMPRAGRNVTVRGRWPLWVVSGETRVESEADVFEDYQLRAVMGASITFTRGRVQAGSYVVIPTIGAVEVGNDAAALPRLSGGGMVFARYVYTLDAGESAPDWGDEFVECELVQVPLADNPPAPVVPYTGASSGVDGSQGVTYAFLMAYDAQGAITTYGQSEILPPDPDDDFPDETVVFAFPQIRYVD